MQKPSCIKEKGGLKLLQQYSNCKNTLTYVHREILQSKLCFSRGKGKNVAFGIFDFLICVDINKEK